MSNNNETKNTIFITLLIIFQILLIIVTITFVYNQLTYDESKPSVTREQKNEKELKAKETKSEKDTRLRNNRVEFIKIMDRYQQNGHISYGITEDDVNSDIDELSNIEESNFKKNIINPFLKDLENEIKKTESMKEKINDFIAKKDSEKSLKKAEELYSYTKNINENISTYDEFKNKSYSLQNYIKQEKRKTKNKK